MVISPFRTQLTRMIQNGETSPSRSEVNRHALERPLRKALWEAKNGKAIKS